MLTAGLASIVYEFGIGALDAHFPTLLPDVEPGNGIWAEHLNAWCEAQALQPETRAAITRALVHALAFGVDVTHQARFGGGRNLWLQHLLDFALFVAKLSRANE